MNDMKFNGGKTMGRIIFVSTSLLASTLATRIVGSISWPRSFLIACFSVLITWSPILLIRFRRQLKNNI